MLPKKNRVKKKDIDFLFKEGKSVFSPNLAFRFLIIQGNEKKVSFVAPKSVAKSAVKRNYLRRCGYKALGKYVDKFPTGLLGIFIFRKCKVSPVGSRPREDVLIIENEIESTLDKIN